jgi:NADH:ubiquinone oxidoreductase subunit 4 (subunit M)
MGIALFIARPARTERLRQRVPHLPRSLPAQLGFGTVSVLGLLITAAVILTVIQRVFTGPVPERWSLSRSDTGERWRWRPSSALMLLLGLMPQLILGHVNATVNAPAGGVEILMLAWTIYLSFAGALVLALLPKAGWLALARDGSRSRRAGGLPSRLRASSMRRVRAAVAIADVAWVPAMGIHYTLAADGISRVLVLLTGSQLSPASSSRGTSRS